MQSADSVPILIALRARVALASAAGEREVALEDLYRNDGIHYLTKRPDELLTEIRVPKADGWAASYRKLRRRGAFDFPVLAVGAAVRREGGVVAEARIVLGAVSSSPVRADRAEQVLRRAAPRRGRDHGGGGGGRGSPPGPWTTPTFLVPLAQGDDEKVGGSSPFRDRRGRPPGPALRIP